ncbi:MAG: proprotein convertase P-domain-containing protein, partial [Gammaproteobacteria bacterium]
HGVTNRLVGGRLNTRALDAIQSGGMGEGWSDYFACTINDVIVVGDWVADNPGGIRGFPYDSDFPDNFGDLGTGRYGGDPVHNIGEIWCAALLEMNRNIGANLGVQLVVDGLKLTPANPSFLGARDGIIAALDDKLSAGQLSTGEHRIAFNGMWQAFARFGMGPGARSNGPSLSGIVADFDVPGSRTEPAVKVETSPDLTIPDNQAAGVSSRLGVSQAGRITGVAATVDIAHSYVGDLRVSLLSPSGRFVLLHDRGGASANDLVRTYSSDDDQNMAALIGEQSQGDWTLQIADLAGLDVGRLRRWSLELRLESSASTVRGEATPAMKIPDNEVAGISSAIAVSQAGVAKGIKVAVDITHTYVGDLRVELVCPSGKQALLHTRAGGSSDNLIKTYDSLSATTLAALMGESVEGNWVLRVTDLAGLDTGKLNRWSLELSL